MDLSPVPATAVVASADEPGLEVVGASISMVVCFDFAELWIFHSCQ